MFSKLYLRDRWTIGFIESDVAAIIEKRISSPQIHWLQHSYTDRFWADPFILDLEKDGSIRVLAEEMIWTKAKGTIVELLISPDYQLLDRWEILEEDVHLSYPFIERVAGEVYVYPESSHKGHLMKYRLCNHKLVEVGVELALPICDATKVVSNGYEWWFGTLLGKGKDRDLLVFYRPIGEVGEYRSH
ncbi:MAG: hypothetical protein Q3998_07490, partial [Porphyromonas sp.]|nr:hypothetical protein [Porphyromonas sp.]